LTFSNELFVCFRVNKCFYSEEFIVEYVNQVKGYHRVISPLE